MLALGSGLFLALFVAVPLILPPLGLAPFALLAAYFG